MRTNPTRVFGRSSVSPAAYPDCATAFQKIALGCVTSINAHHSSACAGDPEAVHQIRVAITRLRAAVSFFKPIAVDAEWLRLKREIAWLNGSLGAARDSDVVVEYALRKRYQAWAQRMIGDRLDRVRARDHRKLVRCLRSARFGRLMVAASNWIKQGSWLACGKAVEPLEAYCTHELDRWRARLIRKGRHLDALNASRLHRLRIRAKRFRYMLEALTEIVAVRKPGEFRHLRRPTIRLQRTLGDLRDLQRFASLACLPPGGKRRERNPPGYRRRKEKLLNAALDAYRSLKQTGVC